MEEISMPTKKKLKLENLKVTSFLTSEESKKVKGQIVPVTKTCPNSLIPDTVDTQTCNTDCGSCGTCATDCGTCETCGASCNGTCGEPCYYSATSPNPPFCYHCPG